ncbi:MULTISPECIES: hypothetical protein [unclassified Xanthobacter]|uniref:hypothetical protein n=1 Tax=unclassified Xanthobacter TaxID=2623496 RepID=UPI001F431775|nr:MULTISPECIES: hypothetical protein [unclassified Xanthobacter]
MSRKTKSGAAMFDIRTARDFLDKLEADFADYQKEPASARLALNCAITAFHLHEWVWGDWLKKGHATCKALKIKEKKDFLRWIDTACVWFPTIQELTNGAKHFGHPKSFDSHRASSAPFLFDNAEAALDEGNSDDPRPFVTGEEYLLIDFGPDAAEYRWQPASRLFNAVVRFWRQFFAQYAPPEQRQDLGDW